MGKLYKNNILYTGQTAVYSGFTPVGTVISIMSNHAPVNYLICDGTIYNISAYPELAEHFRIEFGSVNYFGGNGTTTFAVPDLRGEFLRGTGTNQHTDQGSGSTVGAHQDATRIPWIDAWNGNSSNVTSGVSLFTNGANQQSATVTYADFQDSVSPRYKAQTGWVTITTDTGPAAKLFTTRPTNTSVLYCIAYKNIYVGSGSQGGGHNILDTDGNVMAQEDNLQFTGLDVQDDSTNNTTNVESFGLSVDSLDDVTTGSIGTNFCQPAMNFSTNETVVGKWIDGSVLYQKTIVITDFSGITSTYDRHWTFAYTSSDTGYGVASIIQEGTYFVWHQDGGVYTLYPNEYVNATSATALADYSSIRAYVNSAGNLQIVVLSSGNVPYQISDNDKKLYVTVQYTKAS